MPAFIDENSQFKDESTGTLINNGYVYIGARNLDPKLNPITIYSDRDLSTTLANPQRTGADGRVENKIWIPGRYSLKVEDSNNVQKLQDLDAGETPATGTTSLTNVQGTNTITAEASPAIDALVNEQLYILKAANTNTGAATLQIDSTSAKNIQWNSGALIGGELVQNAVYLLAYNSTNDVFDLLNTVVKHNYNATAAPAATDDSGDGYSIGSLWHDVTNDNVYICIDATASAAIWRPLATVMGTPQATTSGGSKDFTVPTWAKKITLSLNAVSTDGTTNIGVRIGDSGGVEDTNYVGGVCDFNGGNADAFSGQFIIVNDAVAARTYSGVVELVLESASSNAWAMKGNVTKETAGGVFTSAGHKALSAAITTVQIRTGDSFDAGEVNIQYE